MVRVLLTGFGIDMVTVVLLSPKLFYICGF